MSRLINILGIITAVSMVVAVALQTINPKFAMYIMLVGHIASATNKELLNTSTLRTRLRRKPRRFLVFALALLIVTQAGCSSFSGQIVSYCDKGARVVESLQRGTILDAEEVARIEPLIAEVRRAAEILEPAERAIRESRDSSAIKRERLRVAAQPVIESLRRLESEGILRIKNERARARLQKAFAVAEIAADLAL